MKKLLILTIVACLLFSIRTITYAEPEVVTQEADKTIPPIEGYKYSMTLEDVHDLLGLPDDRGDNNGIPCETYYDVEYFGLAGHLTFQYKDNQIFRVGWTSPKVEMSDEQIDNITNTIVQYYDNKIDPEDEYRNYRKDDVQIMYTCVDAFNKTDYMMQITTIDGKTQIGIIFAKSVDPVELMKESRNN